MPAATLRPLRDGLLAVHRELLQTQRVDVERVFGRMSAGELLQASIDDLRFDWLRPLSVLVTDIDAAIADADQRDDLAAEQALVDRARRLIAPPDPETPFGARYLGALQREPGVGVAHGAVVGLLR
jgi:hypothetical protein